MNTLIARVIDELNDRMERLTDNEEYEKLDVLQDFYDWFVEEYIF